MQFVQYGTLQQARAIVYMQVRKADGAAEVQPEQCECLEATCMLPRIALNPAVCLCQET